MNKNLKTIILGLVLILLGSGIIFIPYELSNHFVGLSAPSVRTCRGRLPVGQTGIYPTRGNGRHKCRPYNLDLTIDSLRKVRGGLSEGSFQKLAQHTGEGTAQKIIDDLTNLNYSQSEIDTAINEVVAFIQFERTPWGWWLKASDAAMCALVRILAYDKKMKPHLLFNTDLKEKRAVFGGKSLRGLDNYFRQKSEDELKRRFGLNDIDFKGGRFYVLAKALRILPQNLEQWIERISVKHNFQWQELIPEIDIERAIIEKAAKEIYFVHLREVDRSFKYYNLNYFRPLYRVTSEMLKNHKEGVDLSVEELLGHYHKTLIGPYLNHGNNIIELRKNLKFYPGLEEKYLWVDMIRSVYIHWGREVPEEIKKHLVLRVAQEIGKEPEDLRYRDFYILDFLSRKDLGYSKGLSTMIRCSPFYGMDKFREKIIYPLMREIRQEVESIKREISEKGRVTNWRKYSLWARKTYLEEAILSPRGKTWEELKEFELPEGFLLSFPIIRDLYFAKATLWIDLDLYERTEIHPITTEDWVTRLVTEGSMLEDWGKTPPGVREDWIKMLAAQENVSIEEILLQPASSEIWDKVIDFKSDPLDIFSETFIKLILFMPDAIPTIDWSLRAMLDEVYEGNPDKLIEDLFGED